MNQNDWDRFIHLTMMIAENYNKPFSPAKQDLWWQLLGEYEIGDLEAVTVQHMKSSSYHPTPADLIKMMEPDYQEMFDRCLRRQGYKNDIEKITWGAVGYACRTQLSEKDALAKFTKEYKRQVELAKQPRTNMSHQLENKDKVVRPTDQMIDDGIDKYKDKSPEEIKRMIAQFKADTLPNNERMKKIINRMAEMARVMDLTSKIRVEEVRPEDKSCEVDNV